MLASAHAPEVPILVLNPTDQAPSLARDFLSNCFCDLGIADDYVGRLVVTELVTNAYKHVGTGQIIVRIFEDKRDGPVVVEVCDEGEEIPVVKAADLDALNGRGLFLMAQLVHEWGVRPTNDGGKIIWAKFAR